MFLRPTSFTPTFRPVAQNLQFSGGEWYQKPQEFEM